MRSTTRELRLVDVCRDLLELMELARSARLDQLLLLMDRLAIIAKPMKYWSMELASANKDSPIMPTTSALPVLLSLVVS